MLSASRPVVTAPDVSETALAQQRVAHMNARFSAFLIDSGVLLVFILAFFIIGGAVLLLNSDLGRQDAPDSAYYAFIAILIGGTMIGWTLFNVALVAWRGQTIGKYVIGIRTVGEEGGSIGIGRACLRWLGLHPLFFHPLLLPVWGLFVLLASFVTLSEAVLVATLAVLLLWIVSPIIATVTVFISPSRRALHDRLAGTIVVHAEP